MKLLAWDTSSKIGALAALQWEPKMGVAPQLVAEWTLGVEASTHSDRLLWSIHQLLEASRWKIGEVDLFAVGIGPGSFTGLRIGVTTARTLAHTLGKPLIGVSSLAALARPSALWLSSQKERTILIAATDACKGELFALWGASRSVRDCVCLAENDLPGLWKRGVEEVVITPDDLMKGIKRRLGKTAWAVVGEGKNRYPDLWKELPKKQEFEIPVPFADQVQGRFVGWLAWEAYQAGVVRKPLEVHPRYLRASDAELKLRAGLLQAGPTRGDS